MKKIKYLAILVIATFGFVIMPKAYDPNIFLHRPMFNNSTNEPDVWKSFASGTTYSFNLSTEMDYAYMDNNVVYVLELSGTYELRYRQNYSFSNNKCKLYDIADTGRFDNFWGTDWHILKVAISCTPTLPSNSAIATANTTVNIKNPNGYNMALHIYKLSQMLEDEYTSNSDVTNALGGIKDEQQQTNQKLDQAENTRKGIWGTVKEIVSKITNLPGLIWDAIKGGFEAITNAVKNLGTFIIDGIKGLFIPENMDFLNNFVDSIESKLGFIAEIPIKCIEFVLNLASASWESFDSISFPSISIFGYNFWNSQEIDLTEAINIFKPFKYVTDVLCVSICVRTLFKWYETFTGGE